jgi:hypothetical protein
MKITAEAMSVLLDAGRHEVTVVMDGHRIVLRLDEARLLMQGLSGALGTLGSIGEAGMPRDASPATVDPATLVARIGDQIMSWAQISEAMTSRR